MPTVLYTCRELADLPTHIMIARLIEYQKSGEYPLTCVDERYFFEKRINVCLDDEHRIPWVIPYLPEYDVSARKDVSVISPVLGWLDILRLGDPVELCDLQFAVLGVYAVAALEETLLGRVSEQDRFAYFANAPPDVDRSLEGLMNVLGRIYHKHCSRYTPVVVIELYRTPPNKKAYESIIELLST